MSKTEEKPIAGYLCNRCNQWHEQARIPNKCVNCGSPEFRIVRQGSG